MIEHISNDCEEVSFTKEAVDHLDALVRDIEEKISGGACKLSTERGDKLVNTEDIDKAFLYMLVLTLDNIKEKENEN
jgi:histone H3/H4